MMLFVGIRFFICLLSVNLHGLCMAVANAQAGQALAGPFFSDNTLKLILLNPQ